MSQSGAAGAPTLGVLVPCRNERAVIARKLANLAAQAWPECARPHRLLVVDDESDDGTADGARALMAQLFTGGSVRTDVIANTVRPGKAGALSAGLQELADSVDVVVLTDADVVLDHGALSALAAAFARSGPPGMACGSQRFVRDLCADGTPRGSDGSEPVPAPGRYDRWTAAVRALESRGGRLFSVHGQLLAWDARLNLQPTPGVAADDLDLMRQVRAAGRAVIKLPDARFLEVKTPPGADRSSQELRRARAYFQVLAHCRLPATAPWPDRLQFWAYRVLPGVAPAAALTLALLLIGLGGALRGATGAGLGALLAAALALSPPGRRLARLLGVIAASRRAESRQSLPDRWEMVRR